MKYKLELEERIQILQSTSSNKEVNCIGAAFFLLGLHDQEQWIEPSHVDVYTLPEKSTLVETIHQADFVIIRGTKISSGRGMGTPSPYGNKTILHIAVVRDSEVGILCDRPQYNGLFRSSLTMDALKQEYSKYHRDRLITKHTFEFYKREH